MARMIDIDGVRYHRLPTRPRPDLRWDPMRIPGLSGPTDRDAGVGAKHWMGGELWSFADPDQTGDSYLAYVLHRPYAGPGALFATRRYEDYSPTEYYARATPGQVVDDEALRALDDVARAAILTGDDFELAYRLHKITPRTENTP